MLLQLILMILVSSVSAWSNDHRDEINTGIKAGLSHEYDKALAIFNNLSDCFPGDPNGPFFAASILQSKMMDLETNKWESEFFSLIDSAQIRAKKLLLQDAKNSSARFYLGGALAYKGFYLARAKRYLPGIGAAMAAVKQLEKVVETDSQMYDAFLGIGNYKYWRSRITKILNWLPFVSDKREEGLRMIKLSLDRGTFTRWAALNDLAWIYIDRGEPIVALEYAQMGLSEFPNSRFFLWPAADAFAKMGEPDQARRLYAKLLLSVTSESINNHYNEILLHLKIAECAFEIKDFANARFHCDQVLSIEPDNEVIDRLESKYAKTRKLLKKIQKEQSIWQIKQ